MKRNIYYKYRNGLLSLGFITSVMMLWGSCTKSDQADGEPYLRLSTAKELFTYDDKAHSVTMELFTNMGDWTIEPEFKEDLSWIDLWPNKGSDDGRFAMNILANTTPFPRLVNINIVINREVVKSFKVSQGASEPYIGLDLGGNTITASSKTMELTIPLKTNVGWKAELVEATPWIEFIESTQTTQKIRVSENAGDERSAQIKFTVLGTGLTDLSTTITVKQFDKAKDPYNGELKTIAQVLESLGNAPGKITQNQYVDVFVTSDAGKLNVLPNQMFVQDASGRGMLLEFSSEKENTFPLNSSLRIHLYDAEFAVNEVAEDMVSRGLKVVNFSANSIFENNGVLAAGAQPVVVNSILDLHANLANYENTLVTLPRVEFSIPVGCYANIDEGGSAKIAYNATLDPTNDFHKQYAHLLRDESGEVIRLFSRRTFLDRFSMIMPNGSGAITGIVTKYTKDGVTVPCIHIRNNGDNKVSDDQNDRITNTLVNFGPFVDRPDLEKIMASVGNAQLKTTCYEAVVTASGAAIQYAYTYTRRGPGTITVNPSTGEQTASPVLVNTPTTTAIRYQFTCYNQATFYDFAGSTLNRSGLPADEKNEAWVVNVDEFAPKSGKDLYMIFNISGSYRAPLDYVVEWADNERDAATAYHQFATFKSNYWSYSFHLQQHSIKLPDELKSKSKFTLRLRGVGTSSAGAVSVDASAAVRLGFFRIVEIK